MVETRGTKRKYAVSNSVESAGGNSPVAFGSDETESSEERSNKRANDRKSRASSKGAVDGQNSILPSSSCVPAAKPMHRRRLVGRLANMMSMPTDIFCEIAHYLAPDDLLRLSRSSKALCRLLLSRSSKAIWRAAEEAFRVPECPPDLSSPQFASFIFDIFCSLCLKARAFKHDVIFRIRLCKNCSSANIRNGWEVPSYNAIRNRTLKEKNDIFSLVPRKQTPHGERVEDFLYYVPAFETAFKHYLSLGTAVRKGRFVRERREICRQIDLGSRALEDWLLQTKNSKANENAVVKASRRDDIYSNLRELGYLEADFETNRDQKEWKWKSLIEQPRELTERIWNNIRQQLEQTIHLRREKERQTRIEWRRASLAELARRFMEGSLAGKTCLFAVQELMDLPLAVQEIHSDDPGSDFDRTVWNSLVPQMLELSQTRIRDIEQQCASMVLDGRPKSGTQTIKNETSELDEVSQRNDAAICQLATSFFITTWGLHSVLGLKTFDAIIGLIRLEYGRTVYNYAVPFKWTFRSMVYGSPTSLVDALYKSVDVAAKTQDDMAALKESFVCLCCDPILRKLMTWIELVQHFYQEIRDVERRERKRSASNMVTNVNDHDESKQSRLAAYTGIVSRTPWTRDEDNPELKQWIKACDRETCKFHCYRCITCKECASLGFDISFPCHNKLNAHSRAKHSKQEWS